MLLVLVMGGGGGDGGGDLVKGSALRGFASSHPFVHSALGVMRVSCLSFVYIYHS